MQNVLEVKGLTKKYSDQYALKDVSLSIKKGEIYGLIGKNGAGKTTLIKIITQVIYPSGGSVSVLGSQNQQEWTKALSHTGSVIETPVAHAHMSAYENLRYYCTDRGIPNADKVIKETLQYVGLTDTGKKKFRNFSLGMKQRLGIAIAILGRPDLLILDEPINGLDPVGIQEFREMVKRLNQELGIVALVVEEPPGGASGAADRPEPAQQDDEQDDAGHEHQEHDEPGEQGRDPRDGARRVEVLDQPAPQAIICQN